MKEDMGRKGKSRLNPPPVGQRLPSADGSAFSEAEVDEILRPDSS